MDENGALDVVGAPGGDGGALERWGPGDVLERGPDGRFARLSPSSPARVRATEPEASTFLDGLASGLSATGAARRAGISRQAAVFWRKHDPAFGEAWEIAYSAGTELFEDETRRRALLGVLEPIVFKGEITGYVRKPSDRLMEMVLKARAPEKYRERVDVQHTAVPLSAEEIKAAREAGMRPEVEAAARTIASLPVVEGTARDAG